MLFRSAALGRYGEMHDALRSAELEDDPRTWFFRALAHAGTGNAPEAIDCYCNYEGVVGQDILGSQKLQRLLPQAEEEEGGDQVAA